MFSFTFMAMYEKNLLMQVATFLRFSPKVPRDIGFDSMWSLSLVQMHAIFIASGLCCRSCKLL